MRDYFLYKFIILSICVYIIALQGCSTLITRNETKQEIVTISFFELFSPPEKTINLNSIGLSEEFIKKDIIEKCIQDFKAYHSKPIEFVKVIGYENNVHFYVFNIVNSDDAIVVYAYNRTNDEIAYKFFVPMA